VVCKEKKDTAAAKSLNNVVAQMIKNLLSSINTSLNDHQIINHHPKVKK